MGTRALRILLAALALALSGCAEKAARLHRANDAFPDSPAGTIAFTSLGPGDFILDGRDLFVEDLKIYSEDVHPALAARVDSLLGKWAEENLGAKVRLPSADSLGLPESEKRRVEGRVFVPVRWPWPGDSLRSGETVPDVVLLVGELTLGFDLQARSLYDYELANTYTEPGEKPETLSALLVWTLWDNRLQQYRAYGVAQASAPLVRPLSFGAIDALCKRLFLDVQRQSRLYPEIEP
ncbi:MAG: hypothetical protein J6T45_04650 [Fibrobacterales bacterium]|nr:hypothetical protein [Fibrobacterales bacterium]